MKKDQVLRLMAIYYRDRHVPPEIAAILLSGSRDKVRHNAGDIIKAICEVYGSDQ